jgi:hypothetical protein
MPGVQPRKPMRMTSGFLPDAGVHALRSPCRTATRQHGCHGWGMATSSRGAGCGAALNGRREDAWARRQHRGIAVHTCGHRLLGCRSRSPAARRRMPRALPAPASPHAAARMHAGHAPAAPPAAAARSRCPGRAPGRAPAASPAPARVHRSKVRPLRRTVTKCLRTVSTRRHLRAARRSSCSRRSVAPPPPPPASAAAHCSLSG